MKKFEFREALEAAVPEASPEFGRAVRGTLRHIAREEAAQGHIPEKHAFGKRRALVIILAAALALAMAAAAATLLRRNVFDVTMGDTPANADPLTQFDLASETFGDMEVTIQQAAYDGMVLYIVYGIRDLTATAPYGELGEDGENRLTMEDYERIRALDVGWWWDNIWIDGKSVNMPSMSSSEDLPGAENGEVLFYMKFRLDQENLFLSGTDVEIAMPIGEKQDGESLAWTEDGIEMPEKGMVTFHMDCSSREQVRAENPNVLTEGPRWSAKVSQVVYSPIQMYVTLDWEVNPDLMAAYFAENGDGYYEDGVMLWPYGPMDVFGDEIMNLVLVDGDGKPVFETIKGYYGCGSAGNEQAWYTFPYLAQYPDTMYLAPMTDGVADMSQAVVVE